MTVKELLKRADINEVSNIIFSDEILKESFDNFDSIEDVYNQLRVLNEKENVDSGVLYITNFWKENRHSLIENAFIPHKKCVYAIPMIDWRKLISFDVIDEQLQENDVNEVVAYLLCEMTNLGKTYTEVRQHQFEIYSKMFEQKKAVVAEVKGYFESIYPESCNKKYEYKSKKAYKY